MDLLLMLTLPVLAILCMAADVLAFFICARFLRQVWASRWVAAFDSAGEPLVDRVLQVVMKRASSSGANVREHAALMLVVVLLMIVRAVLAALHAGVSGYVFG